MSQISLAAGLAKLGLNLPDDAQQKLLAFRDLLLKWNKTYNLTALRDPAQAISHHLLDSLAILPHVGDGNLLDVGSGGGLPGIPLAIARPDLSVSMVDTVQKKPPSCSRLSSNWRSGMLRSTTRGSKKCRGNTPRSARVPLPKSACSSA
jgi:16S rRNA G527 N7-methylase RsmG